MIEFYTNKFPVFLNFYSSSPVHALWGCKWNVVKSDLRIFEKNWGGITLAAMNTILSQGKMREPVRVVHI